MMHAESWILTYLLNSLWQAPLVFAAGWLAARILRNASPAYEHRVWVSVLLLQSILPALSAGPWLDVWAFMRAAFIGGHQAGNTQVAVIVGQSTTANSVHMPATLLSLVALAYGVTILYFAARLAWQWKKLAALRRSATILHLDGEPARCWELCKARFGTANASIAVSPKVSGPITLGFRRKLVLLPANMADCLADTEIKTVIAHEYAHMQRNDFARNLLYEILALPVRYHPFCRAAREHVAESREMLCDQAAAELGGRVVYARNLLHLASRFLTQPPARIPQAIGIFDTKTFERRIMKLTEKQIEIKYARRIFLMLSCAVLAAGTCASALGFHLNVDATAAAQVSAAKPHSVSSKEMAGNLISKVNPKYPDKAKKAHIHGTVVLEATINRKGEVEHLKALSGPEMLQQSALDAVKQWTYKPYLVNGDPVDVETRINVIYSLAK